MASIFELLNQNNQRTNNQDSILGKQPNNSFRNLAGDILSSRAKKQNKSKNYLAGALFLGLGDFLTQKRMGKKYNQFLQNDSVNRSKIKQEFEDYTSGGQRTWQDGLKTDIVNKYKNLSSEKIQEIYNNEANNYNKLFNRYTTGKFEGSLKTRKTYEELLSPYEKIASSAKEKLNPENSGFLKNIFGNVLGIKDDADTILANAKKDTETYFNSFNSAINNTQKKYGIQVENYLSDSEKLLKRKNEVQNRIISKQESNKELTQDDFVDAISIGYNPSGFKHLDTLMTTEVPLLIESLQADKALRSRGIDNSKEYLSPKQQAMLGRVFPSTQEEIDAQKQKNDDNVRNRVGTSLQNNILKLSQSTSTKDIELVKKLKGLDGEFKFDDKGNLIATKQNALFIDNVIEGAVALQNLDPITYKDSRKAYTTSFNLQIQGLQDIGRVPSLFLPEEKEARKYGTEYIDPKVVTTPIVPETASQVAEYLNDYKYLQNMLPKDDRDNNAIPDKEGKTYIHSDEDNNYEVIFQVVKDDEDNLVWAYRP
jgi:hypothetical protein